MSNLKERSKLLSDLKKKHIVKGQTSLVVPAAETILPKIGLGRLVNIGLRVNPYIGLALGVADANKAMFGDKSPFTKNYWTKPFSNGEIVSTFKGKPLQIDFDSYADPLEALEHAAYGPFDLSPIMVSRRKAKKSKAASAEEPVVEVAPAEEPVVEAAPAEETLTTEPAVPPSSEPEKEPEKEPEELKPKKLKDEFEISEKDGKITVKSKSTGSYRSFKKGLNHVVQKGDNIEIDGKLYDKNLNEIKSVTPKSPSYSPGSWGQVPRNIGNYFKDPHNFYPGSKMFWKNTFRPAAVLTLTGIGELALNDYANDKMNESYNFLSPIGNYYNNDVRGSNFLKYTNWLYWLPKAAGISNLGNLSDEIIHIEIPETTDTAISSDQILINDTTTNK